MKLNFPFDEIEFRLCGIKICLYGIECRYCEIEFRLCGIEFR